MPPGGGESAGLDLIGPRGTRQFIHSLRHFMRRDRFQISAYEGSYESGPANQRMGPGGKRSKRKKKKNSDEDVAFRIQSIPLCHTVDLIRASSETGLLDSSAIRPQSEANGEIHPVETGPGNCRDAKRYSMEVMSYIFTTPPLQGRFLPEKAKSLGLPPGPSYAKLKSGKSVNFTDPSTGEERTIQPLDVVTEGRPGVAVAVIFCPAMEVLGQLREAAVLDKLRRTSDGEGASGDELDVMIHLTPESIFRDGTYQEWMREFGDDVDHITLHTVEHFAGGGRRRGREPLSFGCFGGNE